jgi:hypothetical protein
MYTQAVITSIPQIQVSAALVTSMPQIQVSAALVTSMPIITINPVVVTNFPALYQVHATDASPVYVVPHVDAVWNVTPVVLTSNPNVYIGAVSDTQNKMAIPGVSAQINTTGDVPLVAAAGAGLRWYLSNVLVTNPHATIGTLVTIRDNSAFNYVSGYAAAAGGGFSMNFNPVTGSAMVNGRIYALQQSTAGVYVSVSAVAKP